MRSSTRKKEHTIVLLSDMGRNNASVEITRTIIHNISPNAKVYDATHNIPIGDVHYAAFVLWSCYKYYPIGSIISTIVDPGIGTSRAILAVHADDYLFIAPDNGVLKYIFGDTKVREVHRVNNRELMNPKVCTTFLARDLYGPVSAHFAEGIQLRTAGPMMTTTETKPEKFVPIKNIEQKKAEGEIVHIDHYGNLVTNLDMREYYDRGEEIRFTLKKNIKGQFYRTYGFGVEIKNKPFAYVGSHGLIEIALANKSAAKELKIELGEKISIILI